MLQPIRRTPVLDGAMLSAMKLDEAARLIGAANPEADRELTSLAYDSRSVEEGTLFFCLRGSRSDGHAFASQAVAAGAAALVCEEEVRAAGPDGVPVPQLLVKDSRAAMNLLSAPFYGHPSRELSLVGITGTNGKTTTAYLIDAAARAGGDPGGLIGTIERRIGRESLPAPIGTPESPDLQALLRRMVDAGVGVCALDVTSIGIDAGRIEGCEFAVAIFTNLTRDHLDHHASMETYYESKRKLFLPGRASHGLANIDDPYGARLSGEIDVEVSTYGIQADADFRAVDVEHRGDGSRFRVVGEGRDVEIRLRLPGAFNVYNALAAVAACWRLGMNEEQIVEGISGLDGIPGRFELVDEGQDFIVVVDFAHSPDSLTKALEAARRMGEGRLVVVFGAEGNKDRGKRPLMGAAVAAQADLAVVTSDNPHDEDPQAILRDIAEGIEPAPPPLGYRLEVDRAAAIREAIAEARQGDVVVIAGKGHETKLVGRTTVEFDDRVVASRAVREKERAKL